jgi:hypothetical protein
MELFHKTTRFGPAISPSHISVVYYLTGILSGFNLRAKKGHPRSSLLISFLYFQFIVRENKKKKRRNKEEKIAH